MNSTRRYDLVLAIYPNTRGFAFALFEDQLAPVDWGVIEIRGKHRNRECVRRIGLLFGRYTPEALVLQDMSESGTRRAGRVRKLNEAIEVLAGTQSIPIFTYSRAQVRDCFMRFGLSTKDGIAESIVKRIPTFERLLPSRRKIWQSEDARMGVSDATALAFKFFEANCSSVRSAG